ncbi:MAG: T9SS type A sorting domain-containing protein, partial [Candidatus Kapaibacterium sp.]
GRYICGAGANNIVYLYDRQENKSYPLENHKGQLSDVCFTSDGKYVLSVSTNNPDAPIKGGYKVTDVELKKTIYEASGPATGIYVAISPDNSAITTLSTTDFLRTWKTSAWTATSVLNNNDDDNVISIFPNPTHTFIKIDFPPNTLNGKLILLDIHGQKVIENDINEQIASNGSIHCDISSLPNGSYLCRIHFNNTTYSSSFIINR